MKTVALILAVCAAIVSASLAVMLVGNFRTNRDLRETNQQLQSQLRQAREQTVEARADEEKAATDLKSTRAVAEQLKARLDALESATNAAPSGTPPTIPPLRANAFLGQKWLGQAWVIASNVRFDTNSGRYTYEPVVALDENLRGSLEVRYTNVVQVPVETQTTYNNSTTYYPPPVYYWVNPRGHQGHGSGDWPPTTPAPPTTYPTPPAFNPGNGTVTPPKVGTPAEQIKTRPQSVTQAAN